MLALVVSMFGPCMVLQERIPAERKTAIFGVRPLRQERYRRSVTGATPKVDANSRGDEPVLVCCIPALQALALLLL